MDFFAQQDKARRKTGVLIGLFALAVISIIAVIYALSLVVFRNVEVAGHEAAYYWWSPRIFVYTSLGVCGLVGLGILIKTLALRKGGSAVADSLGARIVSPDARSLAERRLRNVVEEMAIAAGVSVPLIYVLDGQSGINAFAAGHNLNDAAIIVTEGCMAALSRDELQGVIGHEFSHLLNGDTRLKMQMIGVLHGILFIALTGRMLLYAASGSGRRYRRTSNKDGGATAALFALGLALLLIGYVGVFFGRMIKAAVSRQREWLADASSVQFTRNPAGLAGALKKIAGLSSGSTVRLAGAEEVSHLFFANPNIPMLFSRLLGTHPPIVDRIKRLDPSFSGDLAIAEDLVAAGGSAGPLAEGVMAMAAGGEGSVPPLHSSSTAPVAASVVVPPATVVGRVGNPSSDHLALSRAILLSIPESLKREVHETYGAVALVYGLLLDDEDEVRGRQLATLSSNTPAGLVEEAAKLRQILDGLDERSRLPLVELALPALRQLGTEQFRTFEDNVQALIAADRKLDLLEFALHRMLRRNLRQSGSPKAGRARYHSFRPLYGRVAVLLSALARIGQDRDEGVETAFRAGLSRVPGAGESGVALRSSEACTMVSIDDALNEIDLAAMTIKQRILDACAHTVLADERVTAREAELLRAVADSLGCPLPPFVPKVV